MPTILANNGIITQISVFAVSPERQDERVRALEDATEIAGRVPANVHQSFDGTHVTNYAQSTSHVSWNLIAPRLYECVYTTEGPNADLIVTRDAP